MSIWTESVEELLSCLENEPLHKNIVAWIVANDDVKNALKILVRDRFVSARGISVVDNPKLWGVKQSIGMFTIDKEHKKPKQDYIFWFNDNHFELYTGFPKDKSITATRNVQPIKALLSKQKFGSDGINFYNNHHPDLKDVPPDIRVRLEKIISAISY